MSLLSTELRGGGGGGGGENLQLHLKIDDLPLHVKQMSVLCIFVKSWWIIDIPDFLRQQMAIQPWYQGSKKWINSPYFYAKTEMHTLHY